MERKDEELQKPDTTTVIGGETKSHPEDGEPTPNENYSAFRSTEKWLIVAVVSYASWCSNLSAFIYLPALKPLADAFSVSIGQINLTLTVYNAVATVAPTLVGDAADVWGRRPAYLFTLTIFVVSNICLAQATSYSELLGLRVLQTLGQSSVILIGYGVVADIASPAERGTFISAVSFAITVGPSIGPVLGGALSYAVGWTWIFWFLVIVGGSCLALIVFLLPETSRHLVGNGSARPARHLRLPTLVMGNFMQPWRGDHGIGLSSEHRERPVSRRVPNPLVSITLLFRKDNAIVLLAWGLMYAVYAVLIATLSTLFIAIYGINEWEAGIIYLPFAIGGTVSTFFSGALLNRAYRNARKKCGLTTDALKGDDLDDFPIEKARITVMWAPMLIIALSSICYGWVLQFKKHMAIPLAFQFILGLALQMNFSSFNTLLVDINHRSPAAANASTNLVRCTMAAIATAFIQDMVDATGTGWAFTMIGGLCLVALGLLLVEYKMGMEWRRQASTRPQRQI